ncbi:MAG: nuclear transport factor 2 family protein [Gammaproteobacteria bacterium]|nr:nuclear transport factor 2 family protein [Gammaproteobacteria bacterium]
MTKAEENRQTLENIYATFFKGDFEGWLAFFTDDSVFREPETLPYGGVVKGREKIQATVMKIVECWDDISYDVEDILANDQRAIAYGVFNATSKTTGKKVSVPLAEMWRFKDGKVEEMLAIYGDTALLNSAMS